MIDDGSAEISVRLGEAKLELSAVPGLDLAWFTSLRCEQMDSGAPLIELLEGLAEGIRASIGVRRGWAVAGWRASARPWWL